MMPGMTTPPPPGRAPTSNRARSIWGIVGVAAVVLVAAAVALASKGGTDGGGQARLYVGGSADSVKVSITTGSGTSTIDSSSSSTINLPTGESVYVTVQNSRADGSVVSCRITDHSGTVVATNSASGDYAVASCRGRT